MSRLVSPNEPVDKRLDEKSDFRRSHAERACLVAHVRSMAAVYLGAPVGNTSWRLLYRITAMSDRPDRSRIWPRKRSVRAQKRMAGVNCNRIYGDRRTLPNTHDSRLVGFRKGKYRSRSPSGMTSKKSDDEGRRRFPSGMTSKKGNSERLSRE